MDKIRQELIKYRDSNHISMSEVARRVGMLSQTLSSFSRGYGITYKNFVKLSQFLGYEDPSEFVRFFPGDKDLSGTKIGYWDVLFPAFVKKGNIYYRCRCICGREKNVWGFNLQHGRSASCGCRRTENENDEQKLGRDIGRALVTSITGRGLSPCYMKEESNKNSKSGVRGVCPHKGRWRATITVKRKQINLGIHEKIEDAIAARKAAEEKYHRPLAEKVNKIKKEFNNGNATTKNKHR